MLINNTICILQIILTKKVEPVSVNVKCNGTVISIGGNVSESINGDTSVVTFNNYGNGIDGKSTVGPVYVAVSGAVEFNSE